MAAVLMVVIMGVPLWLNMPQPADHTEDPAQLPGDGEPNARKDDTEYASPDGRSRSVANGPAGECTIPDDCRSYINGPKVYGSPPTENGCWETDGPEVEIADSKFGVVVRYGQANIVQRCGSLIYALYRWSPSDNSLNSDMLNEFYSREGYHFVNIGDGTWTYDEKQ